LAVAGLSALLLTAGPVAAHDTDHAAHRPELALPATELFDYTPPEPGSYALSVLAEAADGVTLDETGTERRLHDLMAGKITVLSFIYTRCGDVCPLGTMLLGDLQAITAQDPAIRDRVRLITLSFDPEYDTPAVMAEQAKSLRTDKGSDWQFLTTRNAAAIRPILKAYDQQVVAKTDRNDPSGPLAHQLRVYLIDEDRHVRNIYSLEFLDPRLVMTDIRTVLMR